jgi:hypothetical protein
VGADPVEPLYESMVLGRALAPDPDVAPLHLAWERLPRTAPHDADAAAVEPD